MLRVDAKIIKICVNGSVQVEQQREWIVRIDGLDMMTMNEDGLVKRVYEV